MSMSKDQKWKWQVETTWKQIESLELALSNDREMIRQGYFQPNSSQEEKEKAYNNLRVRLLKIKRDALNKNYVVRTLFGLGLKPNYRQ